MNTHRPIQSAHEIKGPSRRALLQGAAATLAGMALSASGQPRAAGYPDKPVRIILPFAVGGNADLVARLLSNKLSERTGQTFLIEPKLGANGTIAADYVAKSPADGYTLLLNSSAQVINQSLYPKLPYDPVSAFAPVAQVVQPGPFVIVVNPGIPATRIRKATS